MYTQHTTSNTPARSAHESYDARARRIRSEAFHAGLSGIARLFRGATTRNDQR